MFLLFFTLLCGYHADLLSDRLNTSKIWTLRAVNAASMALAFNNVVNFSTICHNVRGTGSFCNGPLGPIAQEYDNLVTGLQPIIGYNPVEIPSPGYDVSTTEWVSTDILRVDHTSLLTAGYLGNGIYAFNNQEFRYTEFIRYDAQSALMNIGYTFSDHDADTMFKAVAAAFTPTQVCGIIFGACGPSGWLNVTGYDNFTDCIAFLSALPPTQVCPYEQQSNTIPCRALHGLNAFFRPSIHCAHTAKMSMVCMASCLPNCSSCDVNAKCVDVSIPPTSFDPYYQCQCNNGYIGNGTFCAPLNCSYGNCPAPYGSYQCDTGKCMCQHGFVYNPLDSEDYCTCPSPSHVFWVNNAPQCIPAGRCIDDTNRYLCYHDDHKKASKIKWLSVNNNFNPLGKCVCNYGYQGGWEYPCICPSSKRELWSNTLNGLVCLNTTECTTTNPDCLNSQNCHIPSGQYVGTCY